MPLSSSLYASIVLNSVCRSNHHRIAVLALDHLQGADSALWRDLFLSEQKAYLEGAKAPDVTFKDFKNHVLHVNENYWGGAPDAAVEWQRRTVRALRDKNWTQAAYAAGVMSHYVVDPLQPLHTAQTEEENVVHGALEWSLSKAFPELKLIIEHHVGYPKVEVPERQDWLGEMVRAGARLSNPHYEAFIDHYNVAVGVKDPPAGLDQELKDAAAGLIAYGAVMCARILEKSLAEAQVRPPKVDLTVDLILATVSIPARAVLAKIADSEDRKLVAAQFAEYEKTGKVRNTLTDDDKTIREQYTREVLQVPLHAIDHKWPRETGTAHGQGAPARATRKIKSQKRLEAPVAPSIEAAAPEAARVAEKAPPSPPAAPFPPSTPDPAASDVAGPRARLTRQSGVVEAPAIGPKTAERLHAIGVKSVEDLLSLDPDDAARRISASHITAQVIHNWQDAAHLACTVLELSGTAAQLLVACDVRDAHALAASRAAALAEKASAFANTHDGQRLLRNGPAPSQATIAQWIANAQRSAPKAA